MDEKTAMIPYFAHEGEMAGMERANKRLWILLIILIVCLVGTNAGWIIYEGQFEEETYTESYEAQADNNSNAILNAGEGDVNFYGGEGKVHQDGEDKDAQIQQQ